MKIVNKMQTYFSAVTILLLAFTLAVIYFLFAAYREEDFQQRQKDKIYITLRFLSEFQDIDNTILEKIGKTDVDKLYDEKLLIFDANKKLVYSSIDDTPIDYSAKILETLSENKNWYEGKDELYDVVGVYVKRGDASYYGISKAYDTYGYTKLNFLKYILLATFIFISIVVILVVNYVSKKVSFPLVEMTQKISNFDLDSNIDFSTTDSSIAEVSVLKQQFEEMTNRLRQSFAFQKNAVQHISHELKTPIAILVSNFEQMEKEQNVTLLQKLIQEKKDNTKKLSEIISVLLEISKSESNQKRTVTKFRIDDLIYDTIADLNLLYPDFVFAVEYVAIEDENALNLEANQNLIKLMLTKLMVNAVKYASENTANISISTSNEKDLELIFSNKGNSLTEEEQKVMFQHYFRGKNSNKASGLGLGLFFVYKIMQLHKGKIEYQFVKNQTNIFTIKLPLS